MQLHEWMSYLALGGLVALLWQLWGRAARRVGLSRLALLGLAFVLTWWLP